MDMKSDDERLRELFNMKEKPDFNKTIRKAKIYSTLRTIIISLIIFVIISFVVLIVNANILNDMGNKEQRKLENYFEIAMPNAYVGTVQNDDRIMTGEIDYERYRFLGEKPVADGSYKSSYTYIPLINGVYGDMKTELFNRSANTEEALKSIPEYNIVGKKIMRFYYPSVKYSNYTNDLEKLNEIGSNKLMEISLSFDKAYSMEEVKNMLPSGITLNWYWVDTFTQEDNTLLQTTVPDEYEVYGIKAIDRQGEAIDNPEQDFINAIYDGKKNNYSGDYKKIFDTLRNGKDKIDKKDLRIIGVVVSGDAKSLQALKNKNYIKGVTIGAVADKY